MCVLQTWTLYLFVMKRSPPQYRFPFKQDVSLVQFLSFHCAEYGRGVHNTLDCMVTIEYCLVIKELKAVDDLGLVLIACSSSRNYTT